MHAVIYCRVSTKDQVQNLSLPTQEKACIEYCNRHGLDVDKVFVEEGESAKSVDRTELKNLLSHCRQHKGRIQTVVVYSVNRLAREKYDHFALRALLHGLGVTLRSVTEPIDDSPTGKLMEGIVASVAQFDNDVRSERTIEGMKARLERGGWTFPPPLGYLKATDSKGAKTIIPDPKRAGFVRRAFELYASGLYTKRQVLDIVTKLGLRTKSGKILSPQTFGQILRKPIYAGRLHVKGWGINTASCFEALVSQETFNTVQALLDGKRPSITPRMRNNPDFPLRHFVRCGRCDRALTASWSKGRSQRYPYYRCQNRVCRRVNIRREELERLFVDFLSGLQPRPEYVRLFGGIVVDVWKSKQTEAAALRATVQRRLNELRARKDRLFDARFYQQAIDQATYEEQRDRLNEELTLTAMEERDAELNELDIQAAVNFAGYVLLNSARLWTEFSLDQKQRLQQVLFPKEVQFADGAYRTAETSMIFYRLEQDHLEKEALVALPGIEPGF